MAGIKKFNQRPITNNFVVTHILHHSRLTGKMPVPQENSLFVEQASCLLIKGLLRMVQPLSSNAAALHLPLLIRICLNPRGCAVQKSL